jgi:hypothetical protein
MVTLCTPGLQIQIELSIEPIEVLIKESLSPTQTTVSAVKEAVHCAFNLMQVIKTNKKKRKTFLGKNRFIVAYRKVVNGI